MKRPLFTVCLVFVAAAAMYFIAGRLPVNTVDLTDGSRIMIMGELYNKEYKNDSLVLYLKHIKKINSEIRQTSWKNNENPTKNIYEYDKDICIMCYMDASCIVYEDEPEIGADVVIEGNASLFQRAGNPGEFDAALYYQTLGISFRLFETRIIAVSGDYSRYREGLYLLRRYFESIYDKVLPQETASVLKAMVLGNRTELSAESRQLFQKSGISHILAISGLHISFIGMMFYSVLKKIGIPAKLSAPFCIFIIIAFGDMVGMSGSVFRAVFMFVMKLFADVLGRTYDMLTALSIAAVLLVLEQPLYLRQSGFLLSFGAVLAVGMFSKVISPDLNMIKFGLLRKTAEALNGSFSIFLVHFPIIICSYYEFPVYSFLLNLFVIPAMSVLLAFGLFCLALGSVGSICFGMARLSGLICHMIILIFEKMCELSLMLPFSRWITGRPGNWKIVIFYAVVILLYFMCIYALYISRQLQAKVRGMKIIVPYWYKVLLIMAAVSVLGHHAVYDTSITFLDVGQGDCIYVESITGKNYLIDAGSSSKSNLGQYTLLPFLKYMGISRLDAIFLTHLDEDHVSAVFELYENSEGDSDIAVDRIIIAQSAIHDDAYYRLVRLCKQNNIPLLYAKSGDRLGDEKLYFEVLHPDGDYKADSRNAYSLVLRMTLNEKCRRFNMLLTGDVEADGETCVADYLEKAGGDMHVDVYKAAHHGSRYSNTTELLEKIRPTLSVVSCGDNNKYGHPHEEALDNMKSAGSTVLTTKDSGAVTVHIRNGKYRVEEYCHAKNE